MVIDFDTICIVCLRAGQTIENVCHWVREAFNIVWILHKCHSVELCYVPEVARLLMFDAALQVNRQT